MLWYFSNWYEAIRSTSSIHVNLLSGPMKVIGFTAFEDVSDTGSIYIWAMVYGIFFMYVKIVWKPSFIVVTDVQFVFKY
jgi:hypothetical protein